MSTTYRVPDWREVQKRIPPDFRDNGASSPFRSLYGIIYPIPKWQQDINVAARNHDFGYGPGRLPGSGFEDVPRSGWDDMYRENLTARRRIVVARVHWRALHWLGQRAWDNSARKMASWGWHTYEDFLKDVDKTYTIGPLDGME